jgi:carbonic anhydrase
MKKIVLSLVATFGLLHAQAPATTHTAPSLHQTHWGYTGHTAPQFWGTLNPKYQMCGIGQSQSPIDINPQVSVESKGLTPLNFNYHAESTEVINNGHAIQVNVDTHSSLSIDGKHFTLKQFHFHAPSENTIEGRSFPLEAHFVHLTKQGEIAVVAVLFELGEANEALQKVWDAMPKEAGEKAPLSLDAKAIDSLLAKDKSYYRFSGSLTTPPCSEGVRWFVLKHYTTLSKEQLKQFRAIIHDNNRPVQPIQARKVLK